jgi:hypothetical protein
MHSFTLEIPTILLSGSQPERNLQLKKLERFGDSLEIFQFMHIKEDQVEKLSNPSVTDSMCRE